MARRLRPGLLAAACLGAALAGAPRVAAAAEAKKAILAPTVIGQPGNLHRPDKGDGELRGVAAALDAALADTAQDLGLALDLGHPASPDLGRSSESDLQERARTAGAVVLSPSVRSEGGRVVLRLALVDASGRAVHVRTERTTAADVPVRAIVLLRDLVGDLEGRASRPAPTAPPPPPAVAPAPSSSTAGRATLIVNATLYGGLLGFSVQKASGSDDPRVLYPLLAVGAGIGLGGSIIITEEWEVTPSDSWYLAAGMWWPTIAGHLIYQGRFSQTADSDRWEFGLIGGTTGLAIASLGLALHPATEGGAWLAHSGGALGLMFGGLVELAGRGDIDATPFAGMGYGAGLGWLVAAAAATQVRVGAGRVLALDIGSVVGGLAGAAAGSPLVFNDPSAAEQRAWIGIIAGAAVVGGGAGLWLTRNNKPAPPPRASWLVPEVGVLGESDFGSRRAPIVGLSWSGRLDAAGLPQPKL